MSINMSTSNLPVYNPSGGARIGTIYRHELFAVNTRAGGDGAFYRILFLNSRGALEWGELRYPPSAAIQNAYSSKYTYGVRRISGREYFIFKVRYRSLNIYSATGRRIGAVAAGQEVAVRSNNPQSGNSNPHWLQIHYASKTTGGWDRIAADNVDYGYVDSGLAYGSRWNTIPLDGLWSPHF
ncbi:hypothetical protein [Oceanobacillus sp. SE10311]